MSELLKKQNYGVEVEFTGISRKMAADAVAEIIGTTASRPDRTCYQTRTIQDSQGRKWKVMRDSSIHPIRKVGTENMDEYRVESVTPPPTPPSSTFTGITPEKQNIFFNSL